MLVIFIIYAIARVILAILALIWQGLALGAQIVAVAARERGWGWLSASIGLLVGTTLAAWLQAPLPSIVLPVLIWMSVYVGLHEFGHRTPRV